MSRATFLMTACAMIALVAFALIRPAARISANAESSTPRFNESEVTTVKPTQALSESPPSQISTPKSELEAAEPGIHKIEQILATIPSRQDFERQYSDRDERVLIALVARSEKLVNQHHLFELAAQNQLSDLDRVTLATELRRQMVIKRILLSRSIARMKEKYG